MLNNAITNTNTGNDTCNKDNIRNDDLKKKMITIIMIMIVIVAGKY